MKLEEIEKIIIDTNADEWTKPAKEIYKLHLEDKLKLIIGFRSYLISEGFELLADEYFEEEEKLQQELKTLEE